MDDDFTDWLVNREECIMDLDEEELRATRKLNGADRITADKMFESLGYTKLCGTKLLPPEEQCVGRPGFLKYKRGTKQYNSFIEIIFELKYREIIKEYINEYDEHFSTPITIQELKAINKKAEELEWI